MARSAGSLGRQLDGISRSLGSVGRGLTTNLTLPLLAAGAAASALALNFDTALRRVAGLTDVTEEAIGGIREELLRLGPEVGKTPQELAEAFYFVASAGFEAAEAMEVLEVAAKASAAGLGETQTIAQVLGAALNAYGKENLSAARAADILVEAVSKGTAEASEFAGSLGRVIPIAAQMEVPFEQVAGALAAMTLSGVDADEAVTALRQILVSLLKPTAQANATLESLGLSAQGLRTQIKEEGLIETLRTLEEAFGNNAEASATVFGNVRALAGVQNLLGLSAEQLDTVMNDVADSVGRLGEAYEETEGPQRDLDRAMASIQASLTGLGEDTLPLVVQGAEDLAEALAGVARWWKQLTPDTRAFVVQALAFAAALGPALLIAGKLVGAVGALARGFSLLVGPKGLATVPGRLSAFMRVAGRVGPVLLLADALFKLPKAFDAVGDAIDGFARNSPVKIVRALRQLNDALPAIFNSTHDITDAFLRDLEQQFLRAAEIPEGSFGGWGDRSGPFVRGVEEATEWIAVVLEDGSVDIRNAAEFGIEDPIADAVADARAKVSETLDALLNDLESSLAATPDQIDDELQAIVDALADPYTNAERLADIRGGLISDALLRGLTSGDELLETKTFNQINDWLHQWELVDPQIFTTGAGFLDQLTGGMESNLQTAVDWVTQKMGIDFVSQWDLADQLEDLGFNGLAAFVRGMETQRPTAEQKAAAMAVRINTSLRNGADWYAGGEGIAVTWANGLSGPKATTAAKQAANRLLQAVKPYLIGDSPPPLGPLSTVDEGGMETGIAWAEGLAAGLAGAVAMVQRQAAAVAGGLAMGLPAGGYSGMTANPAWPASPYSPAAAPAGGTVNNYNLTVTGRLDVDAAQDALDELRRLQTLSLRPS